MSGRNLFRTNFHTIKNSLTTPHTLLGIYCIQNVILPPVSWISQKTISLGQHGGPQKFGVFFKRRASSEADAAEDAVDVGIDLLTLHFFHQIFHVWGNGLSLEVRFHFPIMIKKSGQIDDKVSNQRERGEGFNQGRFFQEVFDMGSAGQDIFAIDSHGTRAAYGSPTGITERERSILFILYVQQSL
jgi:hypothetical protein